MTSFRPLKSTRLLAPLHLSYFPTLNTFPLLHPHTVTNMPVVTRMRNGKTADVTTTVMKAVTPVTPTRVKRQPKIGKPAQKSMIIDSRAAVEESAARKRRKLQPATKAKPSSAVTNQASINNEGAPSHYQPSTLPVEPKFNVQAAMDHLIGFDPRFRGLFDAMKCRPFVEPLQALDPFRTLTTSIVGQQASPIQRGHTRILHSDLVLGQLDGSQGHQQ